MMCIIWLLRNEENTMKIAIVYPSLQAVGGAENVIIWLAEGLVERGHSIVIFTREYSEAIWGRMADKGRLQPFLELQTVSLNRHLFNCFCNRRK